MLPYQIVNFHAALDKEEKNLSDILMTYYDTLDTFDTLGILNTLDIITIVTIACLTVHV